MRVGWRRDVVTVEHVLWLSLPADVEIEAHTTGGAEITQGGETVPVSGDCRVRVVASGVSEAAAREVAARAMSVLKANL